MGPSHFGNSALCTIGQGCGRESQRALATPRLQRKACPGVTQGAGPDRVRTVPRSSDLSVVQWWRGRKTVSHSSPQQSLPRKSARRLCVVDGWQLVRTNPSIKVRSSSLGNLKKPDFTFTCREKLGWASGRPPGRLLPLLPPSPLSPETRRWGQMRIDLQPVLLSRP